MKKLTFLGAENQYNQETLQMKMLIEFVFALFYIYMYMIKPAYRPYVLPHTTQNFWTSILRPSLDFVLPFMKQGLHTLHVEIRGKKTFYWENILNYDLEMGLWKHTTCSLMFLSPLLFRHQVNNYGFKWHMMFPEKHREISSYFSVSSPPSSLNDDVF